MTKKELLKDLFKRVLEDTKDAERCKSNAFSENDNERWKRYQERSFKLTEELESIIDELMKSEN